MRIGGDRQADLKESKAEFALELKVKEIQQHSSQPCV